LVPAVLGELGGDLAVAEAGEFVQSETFAVDDSAEVRGGTAVGGAARFRVVLNEDLRAVASALGHDADVEAGVEQRWK
jgi:hypothetical protein